MSLDVTLTGTPKRIPCQCQCGHLHDCEEVEELFTANITHNLGDMASEAGVYLCLWYPEDKGITKAAQLVQPLRDAIHLMKSSPGRFKVHDCANGWGTFDQFVPWLEAYLAACEQNPDADVSVSR